MATSGTGQDNCTRYINLISRNINPHILNQIMYWFILDVFDICINKNKNSRQIILLPVVDINSKRAKMPGMTVTQCNGGV